MPLEYMFDVIAVHTESKCLQRQVFVYVSNPRSFRLEVLTVIRADARIRFRLTDCQINQGLIVHLLIRNRGFRVVRILGGFCWDKWLLEAKMAFSLMLKNSLKVV